MLPTTLTNLLIVLLSTATSTDAVEPQIPFRDTGARPVLSFEPRHMHAVSSSGHVVFADLPSIRAGHMPSDLLSDPALGLAYTIDTRRTRTHRPPSSAAVSQARARRRRPPNPLAAQSFPDDFVGWWEEDEVLGPDIERRETLLLLAKMANNAYLNPNDTLWYDLGDGWNASYPVGWEPDADGFRGHVFATPDNSTVVLSIKGTSAPYVGDGGPTIEKDKQNDNLLFSCCCAYIDWTWRTVCGCAKGGWKCDQDCLEEALIEDSLFYPIATNLYNNLTYMYPESNIWIIGHSLGGAIGSLLGATFGAPVVAFEAPGDRMASQRLHLPQPPSTQHITHVYNTADSIAMGACTGVLSACYEGGYAMESRCHIGVSIVYDTVSNLGWSVGVRKHLIVPMIEDVLSKPWAPAVEQGREVPEARAEEDCVDCYRWEFGAFP